VLLVAVAFALPSIVLPNSPLPSQSAAPCSPEPRLRTPSPVRAVSTQPHRASTDYPQVQSKWCLSFAGLPMTLPCALPGSAAAYQRGPAGSQHGATRPAPGELSRSACHCRGEMRILRRRTSPAAADTPFPAARCNRSLAARTLKTLLARERTPMLQTRAGGDCSKNMCWTSRRWGAGTRATPSLGARSLTVRGTCWRSGTACFRPCRRWCGRTARSSSRSACPRTLRCARCSCARRCARGLVCSSSRSSPPRGTFRAPWTATSAPTRSTRTAHRSARPARPARQTSARALTRRARRRRFCRGATCPRSLAASGTRPGPAPPARARPADGGPRGAGGWPTASTACGRYVTGSDRLEPLATPSTSSKSSCWVGPGRALLSPFSLFPLRDTLASPRSALRAPCPAPRLPALAALL